MAQLLHAVVARDATVLAEHPQGDSFGHTIHSILTKIPPNDSKLTYSANDYQFHYIKENNITVLVAARNEAGRRMSFGFLAELHRQFLSKFSQSDIDNAQHGSMAEFSPTIENLMTEFPKTAKSKNLEQDVSQVRDILVNNIDRVLERGERIDLLVDRTDHMSANARAFRKRSQSLRRRMWWKNTRLIALTAFVVVLLLYLLLASACGATLGSCH